MARSVGEWVSEVPHVALDIFHLDLVVGECGTRSRIPIDESLPPINQAVLEQHEEGVTHCGGAHVVHREANAVVVAARAHLLELAENGGLVRVLPFLGLLDEGFATHVEAANALREQALLDDGLRGDTSVVGAGHPHRVTALHPVKPDEHVLQRVVERMPEMQRRGHVRWRDDDRVVLRTIGCGLGMKHAGVSPLLGNFRLDVGG